MTARDAVPRSQPTGLAPLQPSCSLISSSAAAITCLRFDRLQALIGTVRVRAVVDTVAATQHDRPRRIRAVPVRPCRSEQCHHRHSQRRSQVHGTGVAADEEAGAPGQRNQLADRTLHRVGRSSARVADALRQSLLPPDRDSPPPPCRVRPAPSRLRRTIPPASTSLPSLLPGLTIASGFQPIDA